MSDTTSIATRAATSSSVVTIETFARSIGLPVPKRSAALRIASPTTS